MPATDRDRDIVAHILRYCKRVRPTFNSSLLTPNSSLNKL